LNELQIYQKKGSLQYIRNLKKVKQHKTVALFQMIFLCIFDIHQKNTFWQRHEIKSHKYKIQNPNQQ